MNSKIGKIIRFVSKTFYRLTSLLAYLSIFFQIDFDGCVTIKLTYAFVILVGIKVCTISSNLEPDRNLKNKSPYPSNDKQY